MVLRHAVGLLLTERSGYGYELWPEMAGVLGPSGETCTRSCTG